MRGRDTRDAKIQCLGDPAADDVVRSCRTTGTFPEPSTSAKGSSRSAPKPSVPKGCGFIRGLIS